jgi:hypothetical protein
MAALLIIAGGSLTHLLWVIDLTGGRTFSCPRGHVCLENTANCRLFYFQRIFIYINLVKKPPK